MQNLVDQLGQTFQAALPPERLGDLNTFTVFNSRRKVSKPAALWMLRGACLAPHMHVECKCRAQAGVLS